MGKKEKASLAASSHEPDYAWAADVTFIADGCFRLGADADSR